MAVQAQYPSNFLFLNRTIQDENAHGGEGFIDQSQILYSNGVGANPRKRTREIASSAMNPFSLQLALDEQNQKQQTFSSQSSGLYSVLADDLAPQIRHQRDEIDQFLQAQGEQLRRVLAEKRQRHYRALLGVAEETISRRLIEKDVEIGKAARRNAELESQSARITAEARAWQARAKAGEATVASLQAQLENAMMSGACSHDHDPDHDADDAGSSYVDPDRVIMVDNNNSTNGYGRPTCKSCQRGVASVLLLPCRHLSMCTDCDRSATHQTCPVCFSFKESTVEVYYT